MLGPSRGPPPYHQANHMGINDLVKGLNEGFSNGDVPENVEAVCAPPFVFLGSIRDQLNPAFGIAAQNMRSGGDGAYTGTHRLRLGRQGSGCRGFRVQGSGFRVPGYGFWVLGSGFWVLGPGFRVLGSGVRRRSVSARLSAVGRPRRCAA